jgi:hypothetical protein
MMKIDAMTNLIIVVLRGAKKKLRLYLNYISDQTTRH